MREERSREKGGRIQQTWRILAIITWSKIWSLSTLTYSVSLQLLKTKVGETGAGEDGLIGEVTAARLEDLSLNPQNLCKAEQLGVYNLGDRRGQRHPWMGNQPSQIWVSVQWEIVFKKWIWKVTDLWPPHIHGTGSPTGTYEHTNSRHIWTH